MTIHAITDQILTVQVSVIVLLVVFVLWHLSHTIKSRASDRKASNHEMRIVRMESWPNHEERIAKLEQQCEHMEREMNALRTSPFTSETLKRVR